mmetsp:Transcript_9539/g.23315  ORF Transcript_9539/g.23315 Transcript_9539/m.23315 type:complete len:260 (+) Transcript_9539:161-940(+)
MLAFSPHASFIPLATTFMLISHSLALAAPILPTSVCSRIATSSASLPASVAISSYMAASVSILSNVPSLPMDCMEVWFIMSLAARPSAFVRASVRRLSAERRSANAICSYLHVRYWTTKGAIAAESSSPSRFVRRPLRSRADERTSMGAARSLSHQPTSLASLDISRPAAPVRSPLSRIRDTAPSTLGTELDTAPMRRPSYAASASISAESSPAATCCATPSSLSIPSTLSVSFSTVALPTAVMRVNALELTSGHAAPM